MESFRGDRGVTLVELVIVVAIISIMAVIAIPAYVGQQKNAERSEAYTNLQNLRLLEEQFYAENGRYTITLGSAGQNQSGNIAKIQTGNGDATNALPGFNPGIATSLKFSYQIVQPEVIAAANPLAFNGAPANPCYTVIATGNTGSRVAGEVYAIDCFNTKNF